MLSEHPVLESAAGPHIIINWKDVVNFASANYLRFVGHDNHEIKCVYQESCNLVLEKYGVGSCGPCGFYGTIGNSSPLLSAAASSLHRRRWKFSSSRYFTLLADFVRGDKRSKLLVTCNTNVDLAISCRYERRLSELNAHIQEKLQQTRKFYATYNALLEIKELMLKQTSLLNSINSQVQLKRVIFLAFVYGLLCSCL
ncbi:hypothetical protein J1N35_004302 [Gossypium stocksii]|uniref:CCDC93 coiled-coil domain-containing protein n=1 Tax=Gossypium stocksii TaxID=47602 RepID=A0A9D4AFZ2_9ROSI|nr:hypothetical protein J1N35_004302 [Gossypium stocksii]